MEDVVEEAQHGFPILAQFQMITGKETRIQGQSQTSGAWIPVQHCTLHLAREAPYRCDRCRQPYCTACLQRVQGGMVCTHCLAELERAAEARSIVGRLRRLPAVLLAAAVVVTLVVGGSAAMDKLLGPTGSLASTECAGLMVGTGHADQLGAPATAAVATVTPAAFAPQRATVLRIQSWSVKRGGLILHLAGSGFQSNELVCIIGSLSGQGGDGQSRRDSIGPIGVSATAVGTIASGLDFGSAPGGYPDGYSADVEASGIAELRRGGKSASLHFTVKGSTLTIRAIATGRT